MKLRLAGARSSPAAASRFTSSSAALLVGGGHAELQDFRCDLQNKSPTWTKTLPYLIATLLLRTVFFSASCLIVRASCASPF
ncbi:hypothetical protein F2P81_019070 [Scophthalmus maximus]|uniref:Uncharacterized protein n=1 Tax=Scophthalmus maximus TaxID=52904 RepID=A0A6A4SBZ8_SCOMX|nr:hypothetical protein F2P81_019070 [Scophthalmus maximus]